MAIQPLWVAYGRPAAGALRDAIAQAKGGDPLRRVTIVVPANHVGVAARRLLGSGAVGSVSEVGSGLAAAQFLTVYRLAELLGAAALAGSGRRPVSTPVIAAALRSALARRPGVFAPVADHPATETALVAAYKELRDLSQPQLTALGTSSTRAADVVRLHREARLLLEAAWYDEEDLIDSASARLATDPGAIAEYGSVIVYLPQRLSHHGAALLRALEASVGGMTLIAGLTGSNDADLDILRSVERLVGASDPGEVPSPALDTSVSIDRTRIISASDADEEVRAAVRGVVNAARSGVALDRMAVLFAAPEPYARLVHEQLTAADIAHNGTSVLPLTARVAGRSLLGMLKLPASGFRRQDVFAWLAGARMRHEGRPVPATAWERVSRDAGVVAGRDQWNRLLTQFELDCEADAERSEEDPDSPEWRAERLREEAGRARSLREFVVGLLDDLTAAAATPRSWESHARWARGHLQELLGGERHRANWPAPEQRAAERVERALDRLACLSELEGDVSLDVFVRTLELELEADLGRVGRIGEGVLVTSTAMGVGLDLDYVVLLGLTEGTFPTRVRDDSLLPDNEREAAGSALDLRADSVGRQHRAFLAALAGAKYQLLCVPRGDMRRSSERVPSRWVLEVASVLAGQRYPAEDLVARTETWLEHSASFDHSLRTVPWPTDEQEFRLRAILAANDAPAAAADTVLSAGVEVLHARYSPAFTRYDGNLAGLPVPSPTKKTTSTTRIEGWAVCPFAYFANSILGVERVENPEDRLMISALDRGSLVHEVLEAFVLSVLARPAAGQPGPDEPWTEADHGHMRRLAEERCDHYEERGLIGRPIFWQRDKREILRELDRFLIEDSAVRRRRGSRPIAAELSFGFDDSPVPVVEIPLPDGETIRFRGKADRVNLCSDGTIEVIDYKTGRKNDFGKLSAANPDNGGKKLQLPVYGMAARAFVGQPQADVHTYYWFPSTKGKFEWVGFPISDDVLARLSTVLGSVVDGIEHGVFPNNPTDKATAIFVECWHCDPDGLGVTDLRRRMERKWGDDSLRVFTELSASDTGDGNGD